MFVAPPYHGLPFNERNTDLLDTVIGESIEHRVEDDRGHGEKMTSGEYDEKMVLIWRGERLKQMAIN